MRKKQLLLMIIVVVGAALFLSVIGYVWMKRDKEEYARWLAGYRGIWVSADGKHKLTVRRTTSAHMVFSFENSYTGKGLSFASAVATGDGEYTFSYSIESYKEGNVQKSRLCYGSNFEGKILLKKKEIHMDVERTKQAAGDGIVFQGNLQKKDTLPKIEKVNLAAFMGKRLPEKYDEWKSLVCLEEQQGKVSRVHIIWDDKRNYKSMEKYALDNIDCCCLFSELEHTLGKPVAEEKLDDNRYKRVFEEENFRYEYITDGYGLVVEADCQYRKPIRGRREGDFIIEGDTVLRYLGDYEKERHIEFPKGVKRIAEGAFTVEDSALFSDCVRVSELKIPKGVSVEPYAFRSCGKWKIELENGWTAVEEKSFADMVQKDKQRSRTQWVEVVLPETMRRLRKSAFALEESEIQRLYDSGIRVLSPLEIKLNDTLEYIEDDALKGIICKDIPSHLLELGTNFFYSYMAENYGYGVYEDNTYRLPATLKKIARSTLLSPNRYVIIKGDLPQLYGKLDYEEENDWEIQLEDKKQWEELFKRLTDGQRLTEREEKEIRLRLSGKDKNYGYYWEDDWEIDEDDGDDDWDDEDDEDDEDYDWEEDYDEDWDDSDW